MMVIVHILNRQTRGCLIRITLFLWVPEFCLEPSSLGGLILRHGFPDHGVIGRLHEGMIRVIGHALIFACNTLGAGSIDLGIFGWRIVRQPGIAHVLFSNSAHLMIWTGGDNLAGQRHFYARGKTFKRCLMRCRNASRAS